MHTIYRIATVIVALFFMTPAMAGKLWLNNGDKVEGELIAVNAKKLEWSSNMFGPLSVQMKDVKGISLSEPYNIKMGEGGMIIRNDCSLAYSVGKGQWLHCAEGSTLLTKVEQISAITKKAIAAPKFVQKGHVDVAYNTTSGNTKSTSFHVGADTEIKHDVFRHRGAFNVYQEKLNGVTSKDEERIKYVLDYFISPTWFASGNLSYESNEVKDLNSRITLGLGGGHQFFENEETALSGNVGVAFVIEDNILAKDKDYVAIRLASDYRLKTGYWGAELVHRNEFLLPSGEVKDWLLQTDTGLRAPIWGGINGLIMFEFDYDNVPAAGKEKSDSKLSVGLNYSW